MSQGKRTHRPVACGPWTRVLLLSGGLWAFCCGVALAVPLWTHSDASYTATNQNVPFTWDNASSLGTRVVLTDDATAPVTVPFTFQFYGTGYSAIHISSNGFLSFADPAAAPANTGFPNNAEPNALLAPFWDDLNPAGQGGTAGIFYSTFGTAPNRRFVVEWNGIPFFTVADKVTFQVTLYETTNLIKFQYLTLAATARGTGSGASIGIEDQAGRNAVQYAWNQSGVVENTLAILFYPSSTSPTPTFITDPTNTPAVPTIPITSTPTATPTVVTTPIPGTVSTTLFGINRVAFPRVTLRVDVWDLITLEQVPGLGIGDFGVTERRFAGVPSDQNVTSVLKVGEDTGISLGVVVGINSTTVLADSLRNTIDSLPLLGCLDELAVVAAESQPNIKSQFSQDQGNWETGLKGISTGTNATIYAGMFQALILASKRQGTRAIVLIANLDGDGFNPSATTLITTAKNNGISIYVIKIGTTIFSDLAEIARQTGGEAYLIPNATQINAKIQQLLNHLHNQYLISYSSNLQEADFSTRRVCVSYTASLSTASCEDFTAFPACVFAANSDNASGSVAVNGTQAVAQQFSNTTGGRAEIDSLAIHFEEGPSATIQAEIWDNNASLNRPGTVLGWSSLTQILCGGWTTLDFSGSPVEVDSFSSSGKSYWLVLRSPTGTEGLVTKGSPSGVPGDLLVGEPTGPDQVQWTSRDTNADLYFKISSCFAGVTPLPTSTPTATDTPTPTLTATTTPTPTPSLTPTPTLSPTPRNTATPTITPTPTETPDLTAPVILGAGYGMSTSVLTTGGHLQLMAWVGSQGQNDVRKVEVYYNSAPTGLTLPLAATAPDGSELYQLDMDVPAGIPPGYYLLEIGAEDALGNLSGLWPYYEVKDRPVPAPPKVPSWKLLAAEAVEGPLGPGKALRQAASPGAPVIPLAGYYGSGATPADGGEFFLFAVVLDSQGDLSRTEVKYEGSGSGVYLDDAQAFGVGDSVYGVRADIPPGLSPGTLALELDAMDGAGNHSDLWPYLNVAAPTPTPTLPPTATATPTNTPPAPPTATPTGVPATPTPTPGGNMDCCFTRNPDSPIIAVGELLQVDASCTRNPNGGQVLYSWDWGDGSAQTPFDPSPTASHVYTRPSGVPYTIRLFAQVPSNGANCAAAKTLSVVL